MSLDAAMARIDEIRGLLDPPAAAAAKAPPPSTAATAAAAASFQQLLAATSDAAGEGPGGTGVAGSGLGALTGVGGGLGGLGLPGALGGVGGLGASSLLSGLAGTTGLGALGGVGGAAAGSPAQRMVRIAAAEVGQAEQPPGSNDSPRIAQYRASTAGSGIGPWCAYFTSWAAQQAGVPMGEAGQGFGSVEAVSAWAQRTGRWLPAGTAGAGGIRSGDLVVWGSRHIGIVESVDPDGSLHTIEGNASNAVTRRVYGADGGGATGFVRVA